MFRLGERFLDGGMLLIFVGFLLMALDVLGITEIYKGDHWHVGLAVLGTIFLIVHKLKFEGRIHYQNASDTNNVHSISDYRKKIEKMSQSQRDQRIRELHGVAMETWPKLEDLIDELKLLGEHSLDGNNALLNTKDWLSQLSQR